MKITTAPPAAPPAMTPTGIPVAPPLVTFSLGGGCGTAAGRDAGCGVGDAGGVGGTVTEVVTSTSLAAMAPRGAAKAGVNRLSGVSLSVATKASLSPGLEGAAAPPERGGG
eukprot:1181498-Prorocentrum_minimum.AAC.1